jgi:hypothetical protein
VWWYTSTIPALGRPRKEDCEFEASLSYTVRQCSSRTKQNKTKIRVYEKLDINFS